MKPSPAMQYFTASQWRGIKFLLFLLWVSALYRVGEAWIWAPPPVDFQEMNQRFEQQLAEMRKPDPPPLIASATEDKPKKKHLSATSSLIDLNSASSEELTRLPRVGPAIAQRIIEYRQQHGPFRRVHDLVKVRGIGSKTLEKIRPFVTVKGG